MHPEGRAIAGLDEFMLRLGHLSVISLVATRHGGARERLARQLAKYLAAPVAVGPASRRQVAEYLYAKHLASVQDSSGVSAGAHAKARYPRLTVLLDGHRDAYDVAAIGGLEEPQVWRQDFFLSSSTLPSRIGAVTIDTEAWGSKTGVSHLLDWSQLAGLVNNRWSLTAIGRAVSALAARSGSLGDEDGVLHNPYQLGPERLALAWSIFAHDADVLFRLMVRLSGAAFVDKQAGIGAITEVAEELLQDLRALGGHANMRVTRSVKNFCTDVLGAPRLRSKTGGSAWHRVSSRLEILTDLGFLSKFEVAGGRRDFEYYYRPTPTLDAACSLIRSSENTLDMLEAGLAALLFPNASCTATDAELCSAMVEAWRLNTGPTGLQIDAFAVTTAAIASANGVAVGVGEARKRMSDLASTRGDIFSVTRGYSGTRAELATARESEVERLGATAFSLP